MTSISGQALEDASTIASDFIYSIDNIPKEIRHMCTEIEILDSKANSIHLSIEAECQRYVELSRQPSGIPPSYQPPSESRFTHALAELQRLSHEKVVLSNRMISLIARTQSRLDCDMIKIRRLQGEEDSPTRSSQRVPMFSSPATQISESLRSVMALPSPKQPGIRKSPSVASLPSQATPSASPTKKRRLAATPPSIKLPPSRSISPVPPPPKSAPPLRQSRLSRQLHPPPATAPLVVPSPTASTTVVTPQQTPHQASPEDDGEEEADDDKPYCFCQKKSFGDMIACDGGDCPYEWFHYPCVGLQPGELKDISSWYCPACKPKVETNARRRRR